MLKKSLIETNPYLHNPESFRKSLISSVSSSTAVETGASINSITRMLEKENNKNTESFTTLQDSAQ